MRLYDEWLMNEENADDDDERYMIMVVVGFCNVASS
jgi:hypothetical protein